MLLNQQGDTPLLRGYDLDPADYVAQTTQLFQTDEFLARTYPEAVILHKSRRFTMVPKRLYLPENQRAYLEQITPLTDSDLIRTDTLQQLDFVLLYTQHRDLNELWSDQLTHFRQAHFLQPVIQHLKVQPNRNGQDASFLLYLEPTNLYLVLVQEEKLKFANIFTYETPEELLYYVMLVADQFQLAPQSTILWLSGQIESGDANYQLLNQYLNHLRFTSWPDWLRNEQVIHNLAPHVLFPLFCAVPYFQLARSL